MPSKLSALCKARLSVGSKLRQRLKEQPSDTNEKRVRTSHGGRGAGKGYCKLGPAVGKKLGGRLALVACSNEYAILRSVGSLQAGPKNDIPKGSP